MDRPMPRPMASMPGRTEQVAAVDRDEGRHQGEAGTGQEDAGGHGRAAADAGGQPWGEAGGRHHQHGHRHHRQGGAAAPTSRGRPGRTGRGPRRCPAWTPKTASSVSEPLARATLAEQSYVEQRCMPGAAPTPRTRRRRGRRRRGRASVAGAVQPSLRALLEDEDQPEHGDDRGQREPTLSNAVRGRAHGSSGPTAAPSPTGDHDEHHGQDEQPPPAGHVDQQRRRGTSRGCRRRRRPRSRRRSPLARSASGKVEVITARVTGMIIAAPTPASEARGEHDLGVVASPAATLAAPKTTRPVSSIGLRPHRSPSAPEREQQGGETDGVEVDEPEHLALRGVEGDGQLGLGDVESRHRGDHGHQGDADRDQDRAALTRVVDRRVRRFGHARSGRSYSRGSSSGRRNRSQRRRVARTTTSWIVVS